MKKDGSLKGSEKKNPTKKPLKKTVSRKADTDFPIVGIGASAGGLESLEAFFSNMPEDCGMAFVIIQHLDPNYKGIMPELLQRLTSMKVLQVSDNLLVKPNHVYVIPPNKSLSILKSKLHLFDPIQRHGFRLPIDIFFRSLAQDKQANSIGILLSGMGSDGSLGLKEIKEQNGLVIVQDPITTKFKGMPQSAIDAVNVDIIGPANELPIKIIEYLAFVPKLRKKPEIAMKDKTNLEKIIILLREESGHDFSLYKKNTLFRRIERRKGIHQISKIETYVRFLQKNPSEINILFNELLIGVTNFFRDMIVWESLKNKILPKLIEELPDGYVMRAWVPACSTGEEAYSLAIIFREVLENNKNPKNITLQIFATDLDNDAIDYARKGHFSKNIVADVSPERIKQFFTIEENGYKLNITIREMVVFATQDVIKDPPFTKLDILSCRNMLIYMETELQSKLISLFNYSLNTNGIMILGTSETLGAGQNGFKEIDGKCKVYKRTDKIQSTELTDFPSSFYQPKTAKVKPIPNQKVFDNIQVLADKILLEQYAPASVLVNIKGDIIYITGRLGKYLEPVAGKANWNIHAMAREGLSKVLPGAFRKAKLSFEEIIIKNINVGTNGGTQKVTLSVKQLESPDPIKGMIMIVFNDVDDVIELKKEKSTKAKDDLSAKEKELEIELQRSYEELQITREEMQTSQEELQSTNEELQSTNEELQSTNEELTTSKEEMQSLNEELQTVNIELQSKVNDYVRANDDMKNLLNSTEIAILFLDKNLNVRRYTETVTKIFKLRNSDIGRPFTDLANDLNYPEMADHARNVLKTLIYKEISIATTDGRWFDIRIMPYRTTEDRIDGLVITFTDTTKAKSLEIDLKNTNELLKNK